MKVNELEITLQSMSYGKQHSFSLVKQEGPSQLILVVGGKKVATLRVVTMEKEVKDDDGDYHVKPSNNFYIQFEAVEAVCKRECTAMAFVEPTSILHQELCKEDA
jgi:hypothetical protein